jgi:5'-nucleotidase
MKKLIIDMDDVLVDTSPKILKIFNALNNTSFDATFFQKTDFYTFTALPQFQTLHTKLSEAGFFRNLEPNEHSIEVFNKLALKYDIFVVSAAMEFPNSLEDKVYWLQKHLPDLSWKKMVFCGDKSIVKGDVMIDDHMKNLSGFEGEKLLMTAMHNHLLDVPYRVHSWLQVQEILL